MALNKRIHSPYFYMPSRIILEDVITKLSRAVLLGVHVSIYL